MNALGFIDHDGSQVSVKESGEGSADRQPRLRSPAKKTPSEEPEEIISKTWAHT